MSTYTLKIHKSTPRYSLLQLQDFKDEDKIFKAYRQKDQVPYKGKSIQLTSDIQKQYYKAKHKWTSILQILNEINYELGLLYPTKLPNKYQGF